MVDQRPIGRGGRVGSSPLERRGPRTQREGDGMLCGSRTQREGGISRTRERNAKAAACRDKQKGPAISRPFQIHGADNGVRTRDPHLGKVVLYQLSHVRVRESTIRKTAHSCKREFQLFSNSLATCNFSRDDVTSQRFVLCTLQLPAFKPTTRPKKWKPRNGSRSIGSPRHPDSQNDPRVRPRRWRPLE